MTVETIAALADETAAVLDTVNTAVSAAKAFHDPDLQPHAVAAKREALAVEARGVAEQALATISARAGATADAAAKSLEAARPRVAHDPAALIRTEQTWNHDIRPLLDAGASIKAIMRDASVDELLAIERFATGHLRAAKLKAGPDHPLELEPDELGAAVNKRLAVVLPEPQRTAFEDGVRASDAAASLRQIQGLAADTIAGRATYDFSAGAHARTLATRLRG